MPWVEKPVANRGISLYRVVATVPQDGGRIMLAGRDAYRAGSMSSRFSPGSGRTRRRRLLLMQVREPLADRASEPETQVLLSPPATLESPPAVRSFAEMLHSQEAVSWLFAGDSYTPKTSTPISWRAFTARFAGAVRTTFDRPRDLFIDGTFPQARLSEILFEFDKRIAKFRPDVCFLSLSLLEAEGKATDRLEKMLLRMIQWSRQNGCHLVLQTPPCVPPRNDAELTRRLVFVEAVRGVAAEHSLTIVDHWEHWEAALTRSGVPEGWMALDTATPTEEGHRQLARRLLLDLRLNELRQSALSVPETVQSLDDLS